MKDKKDKALISETSKPRKITIEDQKARKNFTFKVAAWFLVGLCIALAIVIPWWIFVYNKEID